MRANMRWWQIPAANEAFQKAARQLPCSLPAKDRRAIKICQDSPKILVCPQQVRNSDCDCRHIGGLITEPVSCCLAVPKRAKPRKYPRTCVCYFKINPHGCVVHIVRQRHSVPWWAEKLCAGPSGYVRARTHTGTHSL